MRPTRRRSPFDEPPSPRARMMLAAASIMAGSLLTIVPIVANVAWLPPCGLLMLLAWRLREPEIFPSWGPLGLGLFDDLLSGQPFGSAMALWTICCIAVDVIDTRLVWRDFRQDWVIVAGAVAFCLVAARLLASPLGAHVDTVMLIQIVVSVALYPLAAALCARLDARHRRQPL